jgi:Icc-related predicted phosphoesterase
MKVLIISDGHGIIDRIDQIAPVAVDADVVLYGGDFAALGKPETGRPFLERLAAVHDRVFAVLGNCDEPAFHDDLESYDMSVESSLSYFSGLVLSGSGGGSKFTGTTPNERTDEELASDLRLVAESAASEGTSGEPWNNLVIIAHNPPKDTKLDMITNGMHVGSPLIRAFIEKYQPLLAVSGHIHESAAIDSIGATTLVNPGSLAEGKYAVAEITGGGKAPFKVASIELKSLD